MVDYVDALLRKGGLPIGPEEAEVEARIVDLVGLYSYLSDKDIFNQCGSLSSLSVWLAVCVPPAAAAAAAAPLAAAVELFTHSRK